MNTLQTILHDFVSNYPGQDEPAQLDLTVGTHDPNRDTTKFRLSDAGKCRLMRYWKRQGKPGTNGMSPEVMLQMQAGNLLHAYIERAALWMESLIASEECLEDDHRIGHFDMVIEPPYSIAERILYDIKTINSKKAYFMEKDGNRADPQHIAQLVSYAIMYPGDLDGLRLAYVVRDTLEIREVEVERTSSEPAVIADWQLLLDAWVDQKEPAANPVGWECKYCQYATNCPQKRG
jgi:CRISPR/Cas system-associated exonuclease Cas4 (RecB family)